MDTPDAFYGSTAKIARARALIAELKKESETFAATNPVQLQDMSIENDGQAISITIHNEGVPHNISTIFGDVIHNLRASLDIAACGIVRAAGKSDSKVYFPFSDTNENLDKMIKEKHFDRAGPIAVELLRRLKPYADGNTSLRAIHDLDLQDKHHKLIPVGQSYFSPVWRMLKDAGQPEIQLVCQEITGYSLVFPPDCALAGERVIPTFEKLVDLVDGILVAFRNLSGDPLFPGS